MHMNFDVWAKLGMLSLLLVQLPAPVAAQSDVERWSLTTQAQTLAPSRCAGVSAPSSDLTLDEQLEGWRKLRECVTAEGTRKRLEALGADPQTQLNAALYAADQQQFMAGAAAGEKSVQDQKEFLGWNWGVGFGFGWADDDR